MAKYYLDSNGDVYVLMHDGNHRTGQPTTYHHYKAHLVGIGAKSKYIFKGKNTDYHNGRGVSSQNELVPMTLWQIVVFVLKKRLPMRRQIKKTARQMANIYHLHVYPAGQDAASEG